eukprot:GHRR01025534.1.p1 GENE.GHRR01025534.1~~GHRR01025534.1.p1  ORF type:complete len:142 (+),score=15.80 GHRR01025534.1:490-915(+)
MPGRKSLVPDLMAVNNTGTTVYGFSPVYLWANSGTKPVPRIRCSCLLVPCSIPALGPVPFSPLCAYPVGAWFGMLCQYNQFPGPARVQYGMLTTLSDVAPAATLAAVIIMLFSINCGCTHFNIHTQSAKQQHDDFVQHVHW